MRRFEDRVAIVTGGATGIGWAVARSLAEEGASVVIAGRSEERGEQAVATLTTLGAQARFLRTDVSDSAAVRQLVERTVDDFGRIDVLVNNGGIEVDEGPDGPTEPIGIGCSTSTPGAPGWAAASRSRT